MRISTVTSLARSASALALAAALSSPAAAQTESTQVGAQQQNVAVECSAIADPAEQAKCVETRGENATPTAGAPAADAIVVTGSRIKRPNFDTAEPAVIIDSAQIEARGFETVGQALNEQPSFGVPGASPVGGQAGSFGSGQSFVNFLGLGDQRTLTLVNGRRFVSSNTASIFGPTASGTQVDLNAINTKLVERVETIAIGGAPIYGSDAIAGTVNIILKRNFEGLDVDAQSGFSSRGDAPNFRMRALAGRNFLDGRANLTASAEFNKGKGLLYNDRGITRRGLFYADCPDGSPYNQCLFDNRRIPSISESGIPSVGGEVFGLNFPLSPEQSEFLVFGDPSLNFGVQDANGNQLQFDPLGQLIPIDFGNPVGCIPCGDFNIDFSGGNGFNLNNTQQLLTDTLRYNGNLLGQYEITDNVRVFGEAWYAHSKGTNLREQPVYNSGLFDAAGTADGPIILSVNNPFLTAAQRQAILDSIANNPLSDQNILGIDQDYFYLSRANTDLASGRATSTTDLWRGVLGLDGDFSLGGRKWTWEVVGNHGRSKTKGRESALVQQNFANAVNAVRDANGNIVCAPGAVNSPLPTGSATCTPLNLFGTGRVSQEAIDYITAIADPSGVNTQTVLTASLGGSLFALPGGDLGVALGVEHRREATNFKPGDFYFGAPDPDPLADANDDGDPTNDRVPFGRSVPIFPVKGSYNTNEAFGELRAPIVGPSNGVPGVRSLELHGAARFVDHSTAGKDWTYTLDGRWGIVRDLALRANFTHAIRAPAITEIFNPSSSFFGFATDPCDADELTNGPDPATRQANCAAAGLSPDFQSFSDQRSFSQAIAGNSALRNERSNAWSIGTILNPRFIPGLTISADYLDIKLRDAITSFSGSQVVTSCYDSPNFPNNDFCPLIQRDANGQLSFIETRYFNAAEYRYRGVLGALDYRRRTPFLGANSRVGVNLSYQYLRTLNQKADKESAPTKINGGIGYPKHSAVLNLNYDNGPLGLFTSFNYTGKVKVDPNAPADFYDTPTRKAVTFVNAGFSVDAGKRMTFHFVMDNVFDTNPPRGVPAGGGVVSYFPGVLGRYMRVGAAIHF
ncbi:MAG: TonB-dependent receptor plug domain-containing protein [Sphingomicrobium sp.]